MFLFAVVVILYSFWRIFYFYSANTIQYNCVYIASRSVLMAIYTPTTHIVRNLTMLPMLQ